jgi:hypothetical protein
VCGACAEGVGEGVRMLIMEEEGLCVGRIIGDVGDCILVIYLHHSISAKAYIYRLLERVLHKNELILRLASIFHTRLESNRHPRLRVAVMRRDYFNPAQSHMEPMREQSTLTRVLDKTGPHPKFVQLESRGVRPR